MNPNQTQKSSDKEDKKASTQLTVSVIVGVLFILLVAVSSYYGLVRF
ncbi:hypothetical protein NIES4071_51140 [Calothrix sp. NIES-4071]|nr:hypothetical protein NIES4071_51140 [Calothrix sp. NIES-4071]BAZ59422.1 hypothetical protein NIES4105_51090 [Calothrix sp. NIES-4105]